METYLAFRCIVCVYVCIGTVNPLVRLSGSGHIDGRIGCTYERKCCMESKLDVHLEWYPIGGGNPISNSRRIGIKKSVVSAYING